MTFARVPGVGWLRLVLVLVVALLVSCGPAAPPRAPVRELPTNAGSLLALAPASYGDPKPIDFGADDRGSASAQAAFEKLTGGAIPHEPALDLVAAVLGRTFAEEGVSPVYSLTQWIHWKCGAAGVPGPSYVLGAGPGMEGAFEPHLAETVAALPKTRSMPMAYGLVRLAVSGGSVQAVVIGYRGIQLAPVAKRHAPGASVVVDGKLLAGYREPVVYVETESADPAEIPMSVAADRATVTLQLPSKPGRYFLQIKGAEPPRAEGAEPWNRSLFWAPLYVGVEEPLIADEFIRKPPPNHPDRSAWPLQIQAAYNAERARLGRQPLGFLQEASLQAQAASDARAVVSGDPPPDPTIAQRLAEAGLPPRDLMHSSGWLEFVSEYTQMRLLQPWVRFRVLKPNLSVLALGISLQTSRSSAMDFALTEYAFEPVKVDPPRDRERILTEIEALEKAAARTPPVRDDKLSADAQSLADTVCAGAAPLTSGEAIWAKVKTRSDALRNRMASSGASYDIGKPDIAAVAKPLSEGVTYTKMGVGVCQGRVEGRAGASYMMLLLMGP